MADASFSCTAEDAEPAGTEEQRLEALSPEQKEDVGCPVSVQGLGHPFQSPTVPCSVRSWILTLPPQAAHHPDLLLCFPKDILPSSWLLLDEGGKGRSGFSCWSTKELGAGLHLLWGCAQGCGRKQGEAEGAQDCCSALEVCATRPEPGMCVQSGGYPARTRPSLALSHGSVLVVLMVHLQTEKLHLVLPRDGAWQWYWAVPMASLRQPCHVDWGSSTWSRAALLSLSCS